MRILDDTLFEQAETFEVILHDAVMGLLEYPEHAIVRILDGEDGRFIHGFCCHTAYQNQALKIAVTLGSLEGKLSVWALIFTFHIGLLSVLCEKCFCLMKHILK